MWKDKTKLSFKTAKPFFTSSEKPLLCLSCPNSTAKSARSCFLSWEDGTQTEADVEKRGGKQIAECQRDISGKRVSFPGFAAAGW